MKALLHKATVKPRKTSLKARSAANGLTSPSTTVSTPEVKTPLKYSPLTKSIVQSPASSSSTSPASSPTSYSFSHWTSSSSTKAAAASPLLTSNASASASKTSRIQSSPTKSNQSIVNTPSRMGYSENSGSGSVLGGSIPEVTFVVIDEV